MVIDILLLVMLMVLIGCLLLVIWELIGTNKKVNELHYRLHKLDYHYLDNKTTHVAYKLKRLR
jgi:hypothetical protein